MSDLIDLREALAADAALNEALAAAQSAFPPIAREKTVTVKTRDQGTYSFSYAPLDAILAAVRPALNQNGLALVQLLVENGSGQPAIRTELRHKDGGVLAATFPLPSVPSTPQQLGSLLTYLRRYAITALLGVAPDEDDDAGQAAQPAPAKKKPAKPSEPEPEAEAEEEKPARETAAVKRSRLMQELAQAVETGNTERRHLLPAGFDDWTDYGRSLMREKYGTASSHDLTLLQLEQLVVAIQDEITPF